jgi:hypothetical protein
MPERPERPVPPGANEASTDLPDRADFERVLRETLGRTDQLAREDVARVGMLLELARRYSCEPFCLEPIAKQLIGLVLQGQFPALTASPEFYDRVSMEIATTLMDDPRQEALLRRFWTSLCDRAA